MKTRIEIKIADADGLADNDQEAFVVLMITKEEVISQNIASALERLHVMTDSKQNVLRYRERLAVVVEGYDQDARELAEVPEVRAFFKKLVDAWPHWLWFLARGAGAVALVVSLLCTVQIHRKKGVVVGTEFINLREMFKCAIDLFARGNAMFEAYKIDAALAKASADSAMWELGG